MRSKLAVIGLVALCVVGLAPSLWAGWMSEYSGYSAFQANTTDGYVSFAVWDRGPSLEDDPSLPQDAKYFGWVFDPQQNKYVFDEIEGSLSGRYIYFYQVVNDGSGGASIKLFSIDWYGFLCVGYVSNASFDSPSPSNIVQAGGNEKVPDAMSFGEPLPEYVEWDWNPGNYIPQDGRSILLFGTSDYGPRFVQSYAQDGNKQAWCTVPAPVPEPGLLAALAGLAMTAAGLGIVRRRRSRG